MASGKATRAIYEVRALEIFLEGKILAKNDKMVRSPSHPVFSAPVLLQFDIVETRSNLFY